MTIRFKCSHCQKPLSVKDHLAGKKAACPVCKKAIAIPVPVSAPADVESFAAEAFADKPAAPEPVSTKTIDFTCDFCDEEVKITVDLGGKRVPCPKCKNIIKVPLPKQTKPKDWARNQRTGPSAAMSNLPEQLSDAWGTEQKGRVSREAMEEAGALPEPKAKPLGVGGWIKRGCWICLIGGIGLILFNVAMSARHANREKRALKEAEKYLPKLDPLHQAEYYRVVGEIEVHNFKVEEARNFFLTARTMLQSGSQDKVSPLEHDLFLLKLVLAQAEMGGSGDDILKSGRDQKRFDWNTGEVQTQMLQTLEAMRAPEAKAAALRDLACKFLANDNQKIALSLAVNLANANGGQRSPFLAQQKAMELMIRQEPVPEAVKSEGKENIEANSISPPDLGKDLTDTLSRVAYAEGHAFKGNYVEAFQIAAAKGPQAGRLEACMAGAAIALADTRNKEAAQEAQRFIEEGLKAYEKLLQEKEQVSEWTVLELIRLGSRTEASGAIKGLVENLSPHLRPRAQLEIFQGQLARNPTKSVESARVEEVGADKQVRPFAWEAWARHNSRLGGGGSIRIDDVDELCRPFLHLGIALGEQDRKK